MSLVGKSAFALRTNTVSSAHCVWRARAYNRQQWNRNILMPINTLHCADTFHARDSTTAPPAAAFGPHLRWPILARQWRHQVSAVRSHSLASQQAKNGFYSLIKPHQEPVRCFDEQVGDNTCCPQKIQICLCSGADFGNESWLHPDLDDGEMEMYKNLEKRYLRKHFSGNQTRLLIWVILPCFSTSLRWFSPQ